MDTLQKLKSATSLSDVANLLGFQPKMLSYILYRIDNEKKYSIFEIPKKSGGTRKIKAPIPQLNNLQRRLANLLYNCRAEMEKANERRPLSHAFRRGLSIVTNAEPHKRRRYVLNLDLEDFFPSINFGRVRGYFINNKDFALQPPVATVIAQIACHDNSLPQGSPCSPIISDLVAHLLDVRLVQLAKQQKCTYTRYADDLTFSTNKKEFPSALATQAPGDGGNWVLSNGIVDRIKGCGFSVNNSKTRMQVRGSRQLVTGLTVNDKVNIRASYYRVARAMCHSLFFKGNYIRPGEIEPTSSLNPIEGVLNHIYYVKSQALRADSTNRDRLVAVKALYRRLLFYKYFVAPNKPLIVCEGKTDNVYLKLAIRKLASSFPELVSNAKKPTGLRVAFFAYNKIPSEVLKIGGGSGHLNILISDYVKFLDKFNHKPLGHPVIILIDNDKGASSILNTIKENFKKEISLTSNDQFFHLTHNLYLIKTPGIGAQHQSYIEMFFDAATLSTKLAGKTFNHQKKINPATEYGKVAFSEHVVSAQADTIDLSGFSELLHRVVAVINHYKAPKAI